MATESRILVLPALVADAVTAVRRIEDRDAVADASRISIEPAARV